MDDVVASQVEFAPVETPSSTIEVMRALVCAYAPLPDIHSVAVIGNGPVEPSAERAAAIDACDLVLRCNSFVLDEPGEPPAIGRRVDVVVFNRLLRAAPRVFDHYRDRLYLMVEPGRMHTRSEFLPPRWPADLGHFIVPNREITLPLSEALGFDSRGQRVWATTGLMSVWIARTLFPEAKLTLAGFSMVDDPAQTEWSHAWGDTCRVGPEHRIEPEGRLLASWIDTGRAALLR